MRLSGCARVTVTRLAAAAAFSVLAAEAGCSGEKTGAVAGDGGADGGAALLTFTLQHACGTQPIQLRFFDKVNNIAWPSASTTISLAAGKTESYALTCVPGARICFGAAQGNNVWGVTLANSRDCPACCALCKDERLPPIRLDCP